MHLASSVFLAALLLGSSTAAGADFCSVLQKVYEAAGSNFTHLKGAYDSRIDTYDAKVKIEGATSCLIDSYGSFAEYECNWRYPGDEAAARRAFDSLRRLVYGCVKQFLYEETVHDDPREPRVTYHFGLDEPTIKVEIYYWNSKRSGPIWTVQLALEGP